MRADLQAASATLHSTSLRNGACIVAMDAGPDAHTWAPFGAIEQAGNIMHRNFDNAGPDVPGLKKDFSPDAGTVADAAVADMIAFDQLGPLTRAAIAGMCVQLSALRILQLIRQRCPGIDESNQQVDYEIATMLRVADRDILKLIDRA